MSDTDDDDAPGWDAIDAALHPLYAGREPRHFGTILPSALGGNDPLQGVSAYRRDAPVPHWHFVTYGFSELYAKENNDPQHSGFGFELTFRLADNNEDAPPMWALALLQNLARYVFRTGNVFEHGHYMNLNGPIAHGRETAIRSIAFVREPELLPQQTVNGGLEFLQVVGLTLDEESALKRWSADGLLALVTEVMPLCITDLHRQSVLLDGTRSARVAAGIERDGSSTGSLFIGRLSWVRRKRYLRTSTTEVCIGAGQVADLVALLPSRLPFGRALSVSGSEARIDFHAAQRNHVVDGDHLELHLDVAAVREIAETLKATVGVYSIQALPGLSFRVLLTEIKDAEGQIVHTIG